MATTRPAQPSATSHFVDRGPCPTSRGFLTQATLEISRFNVPGHALLLARITRFITLGHRFSFLWFRFKVCRATLLATPTSAGNQTHEKQNQKDNKQDLRDSGCSTCDSCKTQHARD
jgi:hypothetical protein